MLSISTSLNFFLQMKNYKIRSSFYSREEEKPLDLLLKKGAKTDVKNKNGLTPLHVAVGKGSHACTKVLIGHGASVNIKVCWFEWGFYIHVSITGFSMS